MNGANLPTPSGASLLAALELGIPLLGPWLLALLGWLAMDPADRRWRHLWRLLGAQLLGAWGLALPLLVWGSGRLPEWGTDPLRRFPLHAALLGTAGALLWFGAGHLFGGTPARSRLRVAGVQAAGLLGMILLIGLASRWDLSTGLHWVPAKSLEPGLQVWYLEGAAVRRWEGAVENPVLVGGVKLGPEERLGVGRTETGWGLVLHGRRESRTLLPDFAPARARFAVHPEGPARPQAPPKQPGLDPTKLPARPVFPGLLEAFGPVPSLDTDPAWRVELGEWPRQGIAVQSRDLGPSFSLALDTPFWSPAPRCGALLPGKRLLIQVGSHLYLLNLERREIACLGRGQGPLAGLF